MLHLAPLHLVVVKMAKSIFGIILKIVYFCKVLYPLRRTPVSAWVWQRRKPGIFKQHLIKLMIIYASDFHVKRS